MARFVVPERINFARGGNPRQQVISVNHEHMRETYRVVQRDVFDLDAIFKHSICYRLDELPEVFARQNQAVGDQGSMKTLIEP